MSRVPRKAPGSPNFLKVFLRRRRLIWVTAGAVFSIAVGACLLVPRQYLASAFIEVVATSANHPRVSPPPPGKKAAAAPAPKDDFQTQADALLSQPLALRVIEQLHLAQTQDFRPLANSPNPERNMASAFERRLRVQAVPGTRLMTISYRSASPSVAADVVNQLVKDLIAYNSGAALASGNAVSQKLELQLAGFRKRSEELQSKAAALDRNRGTDAGKRDRNPQVPANLQRSAATLTQATMDRILKQAAYDVAKAGDPQAILQLSGADPVASRAPDGKRASFAVIQSLLPQQSAVKRQIELESAKFGPSYPPLVRDKATLRTIEQSLQEEIAHIEAQTRADYEVAVQSEESARAVYDALRAEAAKSDDPGIEGSIVSQEAEQGKQLYEDLLKRLQLQDIAAGLPAVTITIVDAASQPEKPSSPNIPLYLLAGAFGGLFLGGCAALLVDARTQTAWAPARSRR